MTDLRPEVADLGPGKAKSRPGKADLKSKEVYLRTGKAILRLDYEPWIEKRMTENKKKLPCVESSGKKLKSVFNF